MKKNYVFILFSILLSLSGISQLSGTYTIDGSSPTSGTNYNSFGDAISALNTSGVSGAVTFNIASGFYSGEVLIGSITGVSASNSITFDGGSSGATLDNSSSTSSTGTIRFLGASYTTFKNLNIINTGYGRVIYFDGNNNNITIQNCSITTKVGTSSSFSNIYNESGTSSKSEFITIDNNTLTNGYYSIYAYGGSSSSSANEDGWVITNNTFADFYYYGIYAYYQKNAIIHNNIITQLRNAASGGYGIYFRGYSNQITNNKIDLDATSTEMGLRPYYADGSALNPTLIANNMITTTDRTPTSLYVGKFGIQMYNCKYTNVFNNTVHVRNSGIATSTSYSYQSAALLIYGSSSYGPLNIQNNIFVNTDNSKYAAYFNNAGASINTIDNNLYFSNSATPFYHGSARATLAAYQTASSAETSSVYGDPLFISPTNLHVQGTLANNAGVAISGITTDIDGDTRNLTTPDIGADEYTPPTCPVGNNLSAFNQTGTTYDITWTPGSADVSWILEYGSVGFTPGSGTSMTSTNDTATLTGLTPKTDYHVYFRGICSAGDTSIYFGPLNIRTGCLSTLSGTYTLDPSAPATITNYITMADWFQDLYDCGIGGPTVLNVAAGSGPYVMGVDISGINGLSSTNSVTMNGNGVTVNRGGNTSFLTFDGITHFTVENFNFINETPNTSMFGIMMRNGCDSITIKNNTINVGTGYTTSLSCGIAASNSITSPSSYGNNANNITIDSNTIIGAYYGIRLNGVSSTVPTTGNKITNNTIQDAYIYSIYNYYQDDLIISNNDISRPTRSTISTFYGVHAYYSTKVRIWNNKIHDAGSGSYSCYPIYLGYSPNTVGNESEIVNNAIYNNPTTGSYYGIYLYSYSSTTGKNKNINIWHNTVDINTNGSSGTRRGITTSSTSTSYIENVNITNNIFNIYGNGTGTKHAIYMPSFTTLSGSNNLFRNVATAGTNNLGYYGTNIATLAAWNTATGMTGNVNANPIIISPGYTPYSNLIDNLGTPLASVTTDIDGNTRTSTPDLGAVEFIPSGGDLTLINGGLAQVDDCYGTNDTAFVSIRNLFGSTVDFSINPVTIYLNITGPVNTIDSIVLNTDTIAVNQTIDLTYTNVDMSVPGKYSLNAYINFALFNILDINDTLNLIDASEVKPIIAVNPTYDTIYSYSDSVKISTQSPFYPGGAFFITEICHYAGATNGRPAGGRPSWLVTDDYIEITGVPNSDLAGVTFEQWTTTGLQSSYTFPTGTVLSPIGTAIIATSQIGSQTNDPSNFIYLGNGSYTGSNGSSTTSGKILRDASGNIIDAVGYYNYGTFPAAAGVTASDWSSPLSHSSGTWGIRLTSPDNNTGSNWVLSTTPKQDPNVLNAGITAPAPSSVTGLTWTLLNTSTLVDTTPEIVVGSYTANGTYAYEASFVTPCGTYKDTAFITVLNQTYDTIVANACDSVQSAFSTKFFSSTGRFYDTLVATGPVVYDSIFRTYDISIDTTNAEFTFTYCGDYTSPSGKVWTTTGTYLDTITNSLGCDSLMTFNITTTSEIVLPSVVTSCDTYTWRGRTYTASTMDRDTVNNGSCDSIFTLDLTINYKSFDTITTTVCDSFVSPSGKVWNTSGSYLDTIPNVIGCDSIITFNLTVNYITYKTMTITVCDTYTSPSGKVFTTTGTYFDTIPNALGCDSALTINLTVNYSTTQTDIVTICPGASYRVGPSLYNTAGTYTNVFLTSKGCDSTVNTVLSFYPVATGTASYNFCIGDSVQVLGNWYFSATTFNDTVSGGSSTGCDTITTHIITTRTVSPALNLGNDVISCLDGGVTIFASNAYDSYNWSTGGTTNILNVTGATVGSGSVDYVLTVTQASSACTARDTVNITFNDCTGLDELTSDLNVNLFPNPANNFVTIKIFDKLNSNNLTLEILNSIGQVVASKSIENAKEQIIMDVNNFSKGLYLVRVSSDNMYITKKLLIQK